MQCARGGSVLPCTSYSGWHCTAVHTWVIVGDREGMHISWCAGTARSDEDGSNPGELVSRNTRPDCNGYALLLLEPAYRGCQQQHITALTHGLRSFCSRQPTATAPAETPAKLPLAACTTATGPQARWINKRPADQAASQNGAPNCADGRGLGLSGQKWGAICCCSPDRLCHGADAGLGGAC